MKAVTYTLMQFLVVAGGGLLIGLAANAANPEGLRVDRDYFRGAARPTGQEARPTPQATPAALANAGSPSAQPQPEATQQPAPTPAAERQTAPNEPFKPLPRKEVVDAYLDPDCQQEQTIFIDARDDDSYAEGHVPGAYQLDHYRVERYLDSVLPAAQNALKIIIYCHGGTCEDSKLAAYDLLDAGIDPYKIFIYTGGMEDWKNTALPLEVGERNSGQLEYTGE